MSDNGRIARFVKAARTLLLVQLLAALLAVALAIWAVTSVWELAAERDRLRAQLDAKQMSQAPAEQRQLAGDPILNQASSPTLLPIPIPVIQPPADINTTLPPDAAPIPPATNEVEPEPETPSAGQDCTGPDATQPRCRPGRWSRPVPQRPVPRPQPEQPQPETPPRPD